MTTTQPTAQEKLALLRQEMKDRLKERDEEVDGLLMALLSRQHILLIGPRGTAKTMVAKFLTSAIEGATLFEKLLMKTTTPSEVFGPPSLAALKHDKFERATKGYLPTATVGFLDEIFKGSSAILNGTLGILNERQFHNNGTPTKVPLEVAIGASNELPDPDDHLEALYDRFVLRYRTRGIQEEGAFAEMLTAEERPVEARLTLDEVHALQREVAALSLGDKVVASMVAIRRDLTREGVLASDRRYKQALSVVRAFAYLEGATVVGPEHLTVLRHVLWDDPNNATVVDRVVIGLCNPTQRRADELYDTAMSVWGELDKVKDEKERITGATEAFAKLKRVRKELEEVRTSLLKENKPTTKVDTYLQNVQTLAQDKILKGILGC